MAELGDLQARVGRQRMDLLADLLARTLLAPGEIPVGVVTAFVGVPFFLVLLRRRMAG
jgi:iron complex transport system permease protein